MSQTLEVQWWKSYPWQCLLTHREGDIIQVIARRKKNYKLEDALKEGKNALLKGCVRTSYFALREAGAHWGSDLWAKIGGWRGQEDYQLRWSTAKHLWEPVWLEHTERGGEGYRPDENWPHRSLWATLRTWVFIIWAVKNQGEDFSMTRLCVCVSVCVCLLNCI